MPVAADIYYQLHEGGAEGQHPPIVLLHGAAGSHLSWPSEVRRLPGTRVYALDLPGHGKSTGRGLQSVSAYGQVVLEWLAASGLHSTILVGHSMGAAIALHLALENPRQILGLGLVGAGARLRVAPALLQAAANAATFPQALEMLAGALFSPQTTSRLVEQVQKRMAETRPSVFYGDFMACNDFNLLDRVAEIAQPALVLCGQEDRMTPPHYAQFLRDRMEHASLVVLPGAGHMVMLERPLEMANALQAFLRGLDF